jgi:hypothetical protein
VHTKGDGKWLMSSVRDLQGEVTASPLEDFDWLIGSWGAEEKDAKMTVEFRWIADRHFIERSYAITRGDKSVTSGKQIIGWNPQLGLLESWSFGSDGSHVQGHWEPRDGGWAAEMRGTLPDGTPTRAVNLVVRLDDDAFSWKSTERSAGDVQLADTPEVVLKRAADKH